MSEPLKPSDDEPKYKDCPTCCGWARMQDGSESLCTECEGTGEVLCDAAR